MKKLRIGGFILFALAIVLAGCGGAAAKAGETPRANKGPIVDKVLFDAKTQEDIAIKDLAEGKSDIFWNSTEGGVFLGLSDDVKAKLEVYAVPSSYWSLLFNPYPNQAPYVAKTKDGAAKFNPFAIRKIRFAMNHLINRKQIVDEILAGAGQPKFTPITIGQPNSSRYSSVASKLGLSDEGNEAKALADIDAAMQAAAQLPENKGKLTKSGQWWSYAGKPVEINFLIRVDDPNGRLKEGRYIADQIEKAGFKVNRLEYDRAKCSKIYRSGDPAAYEWNIYTEGWGGGQTYAFWEGSLAQMYAPWYANMPGGGNAGQWNYQHAELDSLTQAAVNGRVKDTEDYYAKCLEACKLGIQEAVRVFVADTTSFYLASKNRFNSRMVYGIGDGLNKESMLSADVKPDTSGQFKGKKVLRVSEFSARGALFMAAWDPIGPDGFADQYSSTISKPCSDMEYSANPVTGMFEPLRASHKNFKTDFEFQGDTMVGKISVPSEAVLWNAKTQKWDNSVVFVDKGDGSYDYAPRTDKPEYSKSIATATFTYKYSKWHSGRMMDINDFRYAVAAGYDWSVKKGENDKTYEESYAATVAPNNTRLKGIIFNKDGSFTTFGDSYYPMDPVYNASLICPSLMVEASNYATIVNWEILEAIRGLVIDGKYVVNSNGDFTEIDVIAEKCVADIKAKLQEYIASKHVPACLEGFVKPEEAVKNYEKALAFIDKYGHAFISNGAFFVEKYDAANNSLILSATSDEGYPFAKGEFAKRYTTSFARINQVKVGEFKKGADLNVTITVAEVAFPANTAKAAAKANVKLSLVGDKDYVYQGKAAKAGVYTVTIPAKDIEGLKAGTYTLVAEAALGTEAGAVSTAKLIVQ